MTHQQLILDLESIFSRLHKNDQDTNARQQLETLAIEVGKYARKNTKDASLDEAHKLLISASASLEEAQKTGSRDNRALQQILVAREKLQ